MENRVFWTPRSKTMQNHLKKSVLDPKRTKLDSKSSHGHVHHIPKAPSEGETIQKITSLFERQQNQLLKTKSSD